ncbi:MAG: hypothetical protein HUJ60_01595, partial [Bacilli bacterium]|nr:hypothetical protein [Bacilli bacterium]
MQRRRIYENAIVLSPKPFKAYFEVYRNEYPEDGMRVLTLEELEDRLLLRLSPTGETYVRKHSSSKEEAEAKIA